MLKPGMFISDRYEIIDNVGSGGMADVYKAKDQRLNRFVAIKVLKQEYSSDKSFVNKFRGEAQSAAGLSHPNIVNVYDVGDDGGLHYIVMELVEGITLKRFIERKGKLEVKEAIGIAIQIAQGMEAAHDNHIIHRDIKPQNIIISREGKVKVTDFGIAKATNSNTITSNAMGSVHYLSPEQARGGYSDEKSDIYSLGVTMYEMLSGKVPFAGDNTVSVALLHIQGEAMPLRELDPNIPKSVDMIVQKCMQKRPERRYHSASELILDLKRSITNPDGDFVQIPAFVANDSPTINISDDLGKIKNSAYLDSGMRDTNKNLKADAGDDDEELDTVDPKVEKFFTVGSIVIIVILALAIIFTVLFFVFPRGKKPGSKAEPTTGVSPSGIPSETPTAEVTPPGETYKFPNVLGRTRADAEEIIMAKDPKANITWKEDYSDDYKEGTVMSQYPDADRDATFGSDDIIITMSVGAKQFTIPYVYNLDEAKARQKLVDYKLNVKVDYEASDTIPEGSVTRTDPAKDSTVAAGDSVTLWVSTGPENAQATVPLLTGKTLDEAKSLLTDAGLALGDVSEESSDKFEKGKIFYQSETAENKVAKGTAIDVTVSTGAASEQTSGDNTTKYVGEVNIDINPFESLGGSKGMIELYMVQDGSDSTPIYEQKTSSDEFPLTFTVESDNNATGTVTMFVDGKVFKKPGETEAHTWTVNFKPEE